MSTSSTYTTESPCASESPSVVSDMTDEDDGGMREEYSSGYGEEEGKTYQRAQLSTQTKSSWSGHARLDGGCFSSSNRSYELINSPRLSWQTPISACMVDPFGTLPIETDGITNQLLHFYGQDSYWETAYALSAKIKPSIKGSWEYQTGLSTSHFHTLMARSALHQLRVNRYMTPMMRKDLEFAAFKHQGSALAVLREKVALGAQADRKEILTSVISLATFEQRYGEPERAHLHFKAARDIVSQVGFQDGLNDRLREEQALWFEGVYRDPDASFVWGKEDVQGRFAWLKDMLAEVDRIWRDRQLLPARRKVPFVAAHSRLHEFLCRDTTTTTSRSGGGGNNNIYGDIDEGAAQQRCLLIVVCVVAALHAQLEAKSIVRQGRRALGVVAAVLAYADWIEDKLVELDLGEDQAAADLLWVMLQNYREVQPRGAPLAAVNALRRLDIRNCHWRACGIANVVKYLPENRQADLHRSLLAFVQGRMYSGKVSFNEFAFSYAEA